MTSKKFIAYNLMATGIFVIIIAFCSGFFSVKEISQKQTITKENGSAISVKQTAVTASVRENITFILGEDEGAEENYYTYAAEYYRSHPAEGTEKLITNCRSLLEVRNYLVTHFQPGQLPWGKINLVVHGNEWSGLGVATLPSGKRTTVATLEAAVNSGVFQPLPDHIADVCTEIHIHGCAVGRNNYLLQTIGKAFGTSQPVPVKSSVHFVRYEPAVEKSNSSNCRRTQLESWYAFYPKTYRPNDEQLIAQLKKRYSDGEMNWKDALSRTQPRHTNDIYHYTFNLPILWKVAYPNEKSIPALAKWKAQKKWLKEQKELQVLLKEYKMPLENFQWTFLNVSHELDDGTKVPAIKAIGLCTILTVLRPVENVEL